MLHSSPPRDVATGGHVLLLSLLDFELEFASSPFVVLVLGLAQSDSTESIPSSVSALLHEFEDVSPKDLPSGLPPLHDI